MDLEFNNYYTSLTPTHRVLEESLVEKSIDNGVVPVAIRYGSMKGVYRGVVKSSSDDLFYFHLVKKTDSFRLVKADTPDKVYDAANMMKNCKLGCTMKKAESSPSEGSGGIASVHEEDAIGDQEGLITDKHPAAASTTTPDRIDQGRMWHESENPVMAKSWDAGSLLDSLNGTLRKSTSNLQSPVSQKEYEFLTQVVGKTPEQVNMGDNRMNPSQKVLYQQWLGNAVKSRTSSLTDWLEKHDS